eukprot:8919981-Pyramimonas_sp.AAC.1
MRERVARQSKVKREEVSNGSAGFVGTAAFSGEQEHRPLVKKEDVSSGSAVVVGGPVSVPPKPLERESLSP